MGTLGRGSSLQEVIVVVIIIGVLSTLGLSYVFSAKEKVADKEAINNLILLSSAQKEYRSDMGTYFGSSDQGEIRRELKVMISNNTNRLWDYMADDGNGCVEARRIVGGEEARSWALMPDDADGKPNPDGCP